MTAAVLALAAALGGGETYLDRAEAVKLALPGCDRVLDRTVTLAPEVENLVRRRYGGAPGRLQKVLLGVRDGELAGFAMIHREVTRTLYVTFIVAVGPEGRVREVAVMSHDEHIGGDCRKSRFTRQFRGKTNAHRVRVGAGGGIIPYSGATLSCNALARGVRKTLAVVQHHFLDRPENLARALRDDPVRQQRYVMGALCTITAYGPPEAVEKAFAEIRRLDAVLSDYDPQSELSRLNRKGAVDASPDLLAFAKLSKSWAERTGGALDATAAPLVALWGFKDGEPRVPSDAEIAETLRRVGAKHLRIEGSRVTLVGGATLDPGAIGKGIAVDRAAAVLREAGVGRALVDFGSTAAAIGSWDVAVRDPRDPERPQAVVTLRDEALSTSGDYEKFFEADGVRYAHILDPRTGRPVSGVASVSIVAPTATESDALSTAVFVSGDLPAERPAILVTPDGKVRTNDAWRGRAKSGGE